MTKNNKNTSTKNNETKIDLSKIDVPLSSNVDNENLLNSIIEMCIEKNKKNPQFPLVGVKEIAKFLNEKNDNLILSSKDVRRKLQKIRKSEKKQYENIVDIKSGEIVLDKNNTKNPTKNDLLIKWINRSNKIGIEYLIIPIENTKQ